MSRPAAPDPTDVPPPRVVTRHPLNVETPLSVLDGGVTPTKTFYVRSNFPAPALEARSWRLRLHGAVRNPGVWTLEQLQALGEEELRVTLECAGNGRDRVSPRPPGTPWGLGAAGTADFTGVRLRHVLDHAGVRPGATTCVFTAADHGIVEDGSHRRFQRSLSVSESRGESGGEAGGEPGGESGGAVRAPGSGASHRDPGGPLLAWAMNGEPLTRDHGHPVRLVVPRWYAVASVKWLVEIEVTEEAFDGWFQTNRYMYRGDGEARAVRTMRVRSLITSHPEGARVAPGTNGVSGVAWSGEAPVARVEVRIDDGRWFEAPLTGPSVTGVAVGWRCETALAPGAHTLRVRAWDEAGRGQPERSEWNELGYGNNGIHEVRVVAE